LGEKTFGAHLWGIGRNKGGSQLTIAKSFGGAPFWGKGLNERGVKTSYKKGGDKYRGVN